MEGRLIASRDRVLFIEEIVLLLNRRRYLLSAATLYIPVLDSLILIEVHLQAPPRSSTLSSEIQYVHNLLQDAARWVPGN